MPYLGISRILPKSVIGHDLSPLTTASFYIFIMNNQCSSIIRAFLMGGWGWEVTLLRWANRILIREERFGGGSRWRWPHWYVYNGEWLPSTRHEVSPDDCGPDKNDEFVVKIVECFQTGHEILPDVSILVLHPVAYSTLPSPHCPFSHIYVKLHPPLDGF